MKIKHYPGKAVDASLSLDSDSAMGALYEANWLQAHHQHHRAPTSQAPRSAPAPANKLSRQPSNAGSSSSFLLDGISALSKYQMTLESIRQLEQQAQDKRIVSAIKELNGYRPSALQHHQQQQLHNGWVAEDEEHELELEQQQQRVPEQVNNKLKATPAPAASAVNHYVLDPTERQRVPRPRQQVSVKPPSLRRSQTMLQHPPPSYVTLRAPKSKPLPHSSSSSAYSTFSSAAEDRQPERVICQQPLRLMPPPTDPPPAPPSTTSTKQRAFKPLSRSHTSVQRYATIRMPNHSASFCRATARAAEMPAARRHSLEQALRGLQLDAEVDSVAEANATEPVVVRQPEKQQQRHISPAASSNGSSKDLNGEGFSIPRPRLIVPVHTYARRRRTGNLKEQSTTAPDEHVASGKGTKGYSQGCHHQGMMGDMSIAWRYQISKFSIPKTKRKTTFYLNI